jgi:2-oxoisovalerate dehydrogenase E1 component
MEMTINHRLIKDLLRIRNVEQAFLDLFSMGKLNGTVHTCIGQELSALAFAGQLKKSDFVFSNHRCHGHFIAYTSDWKHLILELMGKKDGVCSGVGSSQHLQLFNFFSNGIQGGIMPMAAGFALGNSLMNNNQIGVVYIGDGTLGEGAVYETLNFIAKKNIPLIVVCENNQYAQSTPLAYNLAGTIEGRAKAFGIEFRESSTFGPDAEILNEAKASIDYVRREGKPIFHLVNTYRLKAHSKGDDDRNIEEIKAFEKKDILSILEAENPEYFQSENEKIRNEIWQFINDIIDQNTPEMELIDYAPQVVLHEEISYQKLEISGKRQVQELNECFHRLLEDEKTVFIGEDILDPYGGAFKVSKGLSSKFQNRVIGTTISESLIAGVSNGLALNGFKPYAEFMFGDFTALAFDQFINHASKIYNMYNKRVNCPVVFRTPMGAKRGYGPTHSQSIEKHFVGMDMFEIIALNKYLNPNIIYDYIQKRQHPTLVIENKVDYGKKGDYPKIEGFELLMSNEDIPNLLYKPVNGNVTTTIITYGGSSELAIETVSKIFYEYDELVQVLILSCIDPLPIHFILSNIQPNSNIITLEEGTKRGNIGDNIISMIVQNLKIGQSQVLTSMDTSIPSVRSLEDKIIVNEQNLIEAIIKLSV